MRSRISKLESNIRMSEDESKRNQEAVQRLLEDLDRTRKVMSNAELMKDVGQSLTDSNSHRSAMRPCGNRSDCRTS